MVEQGVKNLLPQFRNRREYFDYLDGWTVDTVEELRDHMTTRALVKGFLLETSRTDNGRDAVAAVGATGHIVSRVDDTLYRLRLPQEPQDWAIMELEDHRYPVIYTALEAQHAVRRIDNTVASSPSLDKAWLSAPMFQRLWEIVQETNSEFRFSQLVFEYESLYESFEGILPSEDANRLEVRAPAPDEMYTPERRRARIQITERIGKLASALSSMKEAYEPLESIVRLRIPAPTRGSHDVYYDGRFTNRSDLVTSLRQTVQMITNIYRYSTARTEVASWPRSSDVVETKRPLSFGAPLLIRFSETLSESTFERWIASLKRKNNRFRLWGNPIPVGQYKIHFYAIDNHLWQPIDVEITRNHLYALLPSGTCGNTVHRLVTNIQRFVDPKITVHVGDNPYDEFIQNAPLNHADER